MLRSRLEFDSALRESLGVRYDRMSWKRVVEVAFKLLAAAVNRHCEHIVGTDLVIDAYLLGPKTAGGESNLFEIAPAGPLLGQWSLPDVVLDTESGEFETVAADVTPVTNGPVQPRVELFDSAGAPVNIGTLGIRYVVPTSLDLSGTVHTGDAATLGLVVGDTMIAALHVNNEGCTAQIAGPSIGGGGVADDCCGVLDSAASDTVTMPWTASHPHDCASYSFNVVRGISGVHHGGGAVGAGSSAPRARSASCSATTCPRAAPRSSAPRPGMPRPCTSPTLRSTAGGACRATTRARFAPSCWPRHSGTPGRFGDACNALFRLRSEPAAAFVAALALFDGAFGSDTGSRVRFVQRPPLRGRNCPEARFHMTRGWRTRSPQTGDGPP